MPFAHRALPLMLAAWVLCAPCTARQCEPYWAGLPASSAILGPEPQLTPLSLADGPALFFVSWTVPNRLYRWVEREWIEVARTGIPPEHSLSGSMFLNALDAGDGIHLYIATFATNPSTGLTRHYGFKLVDGVWHAMPDGFWEYDITRPQLSADFGDGMHIYGFLERDTVARWDGASWTPLAHSSLSTGMSLSVVQEAGGKAMYVTGGAWNFGGTTTYGFARWDGATWTQPWGLPTIDTYYNPPSSPVVMFDDGTGPKMYSIRGPSEGNLNYPLLWRWHNNQWTVIGRTSALPNQYTRANQITVFDDGRGPAIYVTGQFADVNGVACRNIARWVGITGSPLAPASPIRPACRRRIWARLAMRAGVHWWLSATTSRAPARGPGRGPFSGSLAPTATPTAIFPTPHLTSTSTTSCASSTPMRENRLRLTATEMA